jgi:3-phenylpropionate/cinnamic acid dioxygenase small subunit
MQTTMEVGCKQEASDLFDRYVTCLDERRFDEWLDLFADDAFYSMLLHKDYVQDTNMLAIGEDKKRLAGRIEVAQGIERDLVTHMLTAVTAEEAKDGGGAVRASANFAVIRKGAIHCSGRYRLELARTGAGLKIRRCVVVLNNEVINSTIYLPV